MKKLHIAIVAVFAACAALSASDKLSDRDLKLQNYKDVLTRFDNECQVPTFIPVYSWLTGGASQHQKSGCYDLARTLDNIDAALDSKYGAMQRTHRGPAYHFWHK